jgi:hypothetical protein
MFSDVPADGYSVELGQLEPVETRGRLLHAYILNLRCFFVFYLVWAMS